MSLCPDPNAVYNRVFQYCSAFSVSCLNSRHLKLHLNRLHFAPWFTLLCSRVALLPVSFNFANSRHVQVEQGEFGPELARGLMKGWVSFEIAPEWLCYPSIVCHRLALSQR